MHRPPIHVSRHKASNQSYSIDENPHKQQRERGREDEPNQNKQQPRRRPDRTSSGAEAADEARQVQVDVVVVRGSSSDVCQGAAVEVDEVLGAGGGAVEVLADEVLDLDEAVDAAGDGDGALVAEAVLALGLLQQRAEERVLEVAQRHREPALLLPLQAHAHRHAPLGRHRRRRHLLLVLAVHDRRQAGQIDRPTKERARCS